MSSHLESHSEISWRRSQCEISYSFPRLSLKCWGGLGKEEREEENDKKLSKQKAERTQYFYQQVMNDEKRTMKKKPPQKRKKREQKCFINARSTACCFQEVPISYQFLDQQGGGIFFPIPPGLICGFVLNFIGKSLASFHT